MFIPTEDEIKRNHYLNEEARKKQQQMREEKSGRKEEARKEMIKNMINYENEEY